MFCPDAGDTRFGTAFMCLQRLTEVRKALENTVIDESWDDWVESTANIRAKAEKAKSQVNSSDWRKSVDRLVDIFKPIYAFLRLMDSNAPSMGLVRTLKYL